MTLKKELKAFNIDVDDLKIEEFNMDMMQDFISNIAIAFDKDRYEIILNKNILNIKDKYTGMHSFMGLNLSLEPLEKEISFIVTPKKAPSYEQLQQENQQLKNRINYLQRELNDENLQCSKYAIDIQQLKIQISAREEEYRKLEDNWNKLKEYLHNQIPTDKTVLTKHIKIFEVLDKIQELEDKSDVED